MTDLTNTILECIAHNPGCRQRYIASYCHVWYLDSVFLKTLFALRDSGLIYSESYSDPAQMEYYNKWYIR